MKRLLTALLFLMLATASCGVMVPRNAVVINDHEQMMDIIQEHFPELYDLHEQGLVEVDEIYFYHTRSGEPKYKVSFRYIPAHTDCD